VSGERVIETRGLRKQFGRKLAVADLSLSVGRGEVFGFLGPNGAGKTTSLKMLLGLVEPTAGRATVLGAPLGNRAARGRLGFLPEHFRFQDWLTGRELLRFHGQLLGMPRPRLEARIDELLARVDLLDAAPRRLREYSKGMLQRVGLAQALLNEPDLVFLDEPTSGLDPLGRLLVRDMIRDLKARGTAVFLNSHLLGEVEATCDRVVFVKQGRAIRDLSLAAADKDLEVELRVTPVNGEILEGLARFGGAPTHQDGVVRLRVASEESLPEIARWLVERGARVYRLESRRPSLESMFLEVMGQDQRPG
jgi:ABC-2 type transport system ATP-binding protein